MPDLYGVRWRRVLFFVRNLQESSATFFRYEASKREVDKQLKLVNKAQDELNQLNTTLHQVEDYNEQMKGEIGITRRATYKAEDVIKKKEKVKKQQDLVIDKYFINIL